MDPNFLDDAIRELTRDEMVEALTDALALVETAANIMQSMVENGTNNTNVTASAIWALAAFSWQESTVR